MSAFNRSAYHALVSVDSRGRVAHIANGQLVLDRVPEISIEIDPAGRVAYFVADRVVDRETYLAVVATIAAWQGASAGGVS